MSRRADYCLSAFLLLRSFYSANQSLRYCYLFNKLNVEHASTLKRAGKESQTVLYCIYWAWYTKVHIFIRQSSLDKLTALI